MNTNTWQFCGFHKIVFLLYHKMIFLSSIIQHLARYNINLKIALLFGYLPGYEIYIFLLAYHPIYWYTYHPNNLSLNMMNSKAVKWKKLKAKSLILGRN